MLPKVTLWGFFTLLSLAMPAWGSIYTVDELFMLPLHELMATSVDMVLLPK